MIAGRHKEHIVLLGTDLLPSATASWLQMHKERIALREGKPLTTDFQFLKSSQTRRLLSNRPFFLRLSSATSPCNVRQLLHAPNRAAAPGEGSCPHCPGITALQQLSAAREGSCRGWMAQHCEGRKDGRTEENIQRNIYLLCFL